MTQPVVSPAREATCRLSEPGSDAAAEGDAASSGNGSRLPASLWPQLFQSAAESDRGVWLARARAAGLVHYHEIAPPDSQPSNLTGLSEILAGRAALPRSQDTFGEGDFPFFDADLDEDQRQAVRSALAARDIFLLQGPPGTGKSRVLAELATQSAARGRKMLLTSPSALSLERVFAHLKNYDHVLAVRWLERHEDPAHLPESVREHVLPGRAERLRAQSLAAVEAEIARREPERDALQQEQRLLAELRSVAAQAHALDTRHQELVGQRQRLPAAVAAEAAVVAAGGPADPALAKALDNEQVRHLAARQELDKRLQEARAQCSVREEDLRKWQAQVHSQSEIMAARKRWRYLSLKFWRGLFQGRASERLEEFQCRATEAAAALEAARAEYETLQNQHAIEIARNATALEQIVASETTRRQLGIEGQLSELLKSQEAAGESWTGQRGRLRAPSELPASPSASALERLLGLLEERRAENERLLSFALSWKAALAELRPDADALLAPYVNLLAVTVASLQEEPGHRLFAQDFDLVVIDQSDRLTAAELEALAARGRCCVLAGHPPPPILEGAERPALAAFHELWQRLHTDLSSLPCLWLQDGGALVCQLVALTAEQRTALESECLVDQPDVELRILSLPGARPVLAEVVFTGSSFTLPSAKAYLYQQLGELTLRPESSQLRWRQQGTKLLLEMAALPGEPGAATRVELEEGVCEVVQPQTGGALPLRWSTIRLEFDSSQGWTRPRASAWLRERAGLADEGRTAALEINYRAHPEVTAFTAAMLGGMGHEPAIPAPAQQRTASATVRGSSDDAHVRFVPARATISGKAQRPRSGKPRPPSNGSTQPAGSELDLADARQRQRLPLELQLKLPMRGWVNLAEAEQILRLLENFASGDQAGRRPEVAVLSWQLPQVQLIEHLWMRSAHAGAGLRLRFSTASGFRDAEAEVVLLSLARSHEQRALPFADQPLDWQLALGGARRQLLLVGDLDTLHRRGRAHGAIGRQSDYLAALERGVCDRLARHFTVSAQPARPAPAREGVPI